MCLAQHKTTIIRFFQYDGNKFFIPLNLPEDFEKNIQLVMVNRKKPGMCIKAKDLIKLMGDKAWLVADLQSVEYIICKDLYNGQIIRVDYSE